MDPMFFAGIAQKEDLIVEYTMEYLNVTDLDGSTNEKAACRRLIILLLQELCGMTNLQATKKMEVSPHAATYVNREYKKYYHGHSDIYHYIYLNVKNKILGKKYYTLRDMYKDAVKSFPESEDLLFFNAKPFCIYLVRQGMSTTEIATLFNIEDKSTIIGMTVDKKDLYLTAIQNAVRSKIIELQQTEQDEKRRID